MSESKSFEGKFSLSGLQPAWKAFICSVCLVFLADARADPFRNFNFEDYDPARSPRLSGWHISSLFTSVRINETNIGIGAPAPPNDGFFAAMVETASYPNQGLEGKYALSMRPSLWTLSQRGDVPLDAKFLSWVSLGNIPAELKIDGTIVPVNYLYESVTQTTHSYAIADISAYAGKNVGLEMTTQSSPPWLSGPGLSGYSIIDDIRFSPVLPIPEPSTLALLGLGGLALLWSRKKIRA